MSFVQKFDSQALVFRLADHFSFIVVNIKVLACVNHCEVLWSLYNSVNRVTDVKHKRRRPVLCLNVVHIALTCCTNNHESILKRHVYNTLTEVKIFTHLMQAISNIDFVVFIKHSFNICILKLEINNIPEHNRTVSTSASTNCSIIWPWKIKKWASHRFVKAMRPTSFIAKTSTNLRRSHFSYFGRKVMFWHTWYLI